MLTHQRGVISIMALQTKKINPYGIHDKPFDLDTRSLSPSERRRKEAIKKYSDSIKAYQREDPTLEKAPVSLKA